MNSLAREVHSNSVDKGFYHNYSVIREVLGEAAISDALWWELKEAVTRYEACTKLLLVITELSEIVEEWRNEKVIVTEAVCEEFADAFIRLLDLTAFLDIDIDTAIKAKAEKNGGRPHKHGKNF